MPAKDQQGNIVVQANYFLNECESYKELIKQGKMKVVLLVNCSKLSFRKSYEFDNNSNSLQICIDSMSVTDDVVFTAYLVANDDIVVDFPEINKEWQSLKACVQKNNVIGETEDETLRVKHSNKRGGSNSIFSFVPRSGAKDNEPIYVTLGQDRIIFSMSENRLNQYRLIQRKSWQVVLGSVIFPVIVEIFEKMKAEPDPDTDTNDFVSQYRNKTWYTVLSTQYKAVFNKDGDMESEDAVDPENPKTAKDPFFAAQVLLKEPINNCFEYAFEAQKNNRQINDPEE